MMMSCADGVARRVSEGEWQKLKARKRIAYDLFMAEPAGTFGHAHMQADYLFALRWALDDDGSTQPITTAVRKHIPYDTGKAAAMQTRLETILRKALGATV